MIEGDEAPMIDGDEARGHGSASGDDEAGVMGGARRLHTVFSGERAERQRHDSLRAGAP